MPRVAAEPPRRRVALVVARADNGVIGHAGHLPWHLPADLRHFKQLTVGKPVIMGRKTWESLGRPLPGRHNIVISRNSAYRAEGATLVPNLAEAIAATGLDPRLRAEVVMIIGGAEIYRQALPFADVVHLTEVHASPEGDTVLPAFDPAVWRETARTEHAAEEQRPAFSFVTLERLAG